MVIWLLLLSLSAVLCLLVCTCWPNFTSMEWIPLGHNTRVLDFDLQEFYENHCLYVPHGNWLIDFVVVVVVVFLLGFGVRGVRIILAFYSDFGSISFLSILWSNFRSIGFFKELVEFGSKSLDFLCWDAFYYCFNPIIAITPSKSFISSGIISVEHLHLIIYSLPLDLSVLWDLSFQSSL